MWSNSQCSALARQKDPKRKGKIYRRSISRKAAMKIITLHLLQEYPISRGRNYLLSHRNGICASIYFLLRVFFIYYYSYELEEENSPQEIIRKIRNQLYVLLYSYTFSLVLLYIFKYHDQVESKYIRFLILPLRNEINLYYKLFLINLFSYSIITGS